MKNYKHSDYALNKYSPHIVYRFDDEIIEVTLEDYIKQNPDKTPEDFAKLKALSDENYHQSDLEDTYYRKRKLSMHPLEYGTELGTYSFEDSVHEEADKKQALLAAKQLLEKGNLTEVQKRRFIQHYIEGVPMRAIARREGVHLKSIQESMQAANRKLENIFKKI
ncbi:MAG: RNA polymerase subunit sigma-24 [Lachnospiraceae bacterium]